MSGLTPRLKLELTPRPKLDLECSRRRQRRVVDCMQQIGVERGLAGDRRGLRSRHGPVTAEAFAQLLEMMFASLDAAPSLDGLLVGPHGATVAASHRDADGHWMAELRKRLDATLPIIGTLNAHANLSPQMVE